MKGLLRVKWAKPTSDNRNKASTHSKTPLPLSPPPLLLIYPHPHHSLQPPLFLPPLPPLPVALRLLLSAPPPSLFSPKTPPFLLHLSNARPSSRSTHPLSRAILQSRSPPRPRCLLPPLCSLTVALFLVCFLVYVALSFIKYK